MRQVGHKRRLVQQRLGRVQLSLQSLHGHLARQPIAEHHVAKLSFADGVACDFGQKVQKNKIL